MKRNTIKKSSGTDWRRSRKASDTDIDLSDIPELTEEFFKSAVVRLPKNKTSVTLRLDPDVVDWFKHQGKGYQTRINAVLRTYMEAKTAR